MGEWLNAASGATVSTPAGVLDNALSRPQFRLRVNEFRVFYDIIEKEVQVLAIVSKDEADAWLQEYGSATP